tara:strand:- start:58 stop:606 length:549 start_codon:yes stop_codon:yes gene_type:complete
MSAALVLDIDGTIDTADPLQLQRIVEYTDKHNVNRYINTARSQGYCRNPDDLTTTIAGPKSHARHHCLVHPDPPVSKVMNMEKIRRREQIDDPRCVVLVDDRAENIKAVRAAGYSAIKVRSRTGIRRGTVNSAQRLVRRCLADQKTRGAGNAVDDGGYIKRLLARTALFVVIIMLLALLWRI